jgi:hypothetical protein
VRRWQRRENYIHQDIMHGDLGRTGKEMVVFYLKILCCRKAPETLVRIVGAP